MVPPSASPEMRIQNGGGLSRMRGQLARTVLRGGGHSDAISLPDLRLPLTDPGFDHTVLSEFRSRLIEGKAEQQMLDTLLDRLRDLGLVKPRGRQRTDSTHVLAAVRGLNRLERVGETLRAALNEVAVMAPAWLQALAPAEWYERYARRVENYRLPKTDAARQELAAAIGADGSTLLRAIDQATGQPWLAQIPAVQALRRVLGGQNFEGGGGGSGGGGKEKAAPPPPKKKQNRKFGGPIFPGPAPKP